MSDFYCNIYDKIVQLKYKKKHSNTKFYRASSLSIINRYRVKNPTFLEIEVILKQRVHEYIERFRFYIIICEWKLDFDNTIICVKSERK